MTTWLKIRVAEISYDRPTTYERYAPNQLTTFDAIASALAEYQRKEKERLERLIDEAEADSRKRQADFEQKKKEEAEKEGDKNKEKEKDIPNGRFDSEATSSEGNEVPTSEATI